MFNLNTGLLEFLRPQLSTAIFNFIFIASLIGIVAISYLSGSINSAIIISKTLYNDDVRQHGSGNPGLTNMLRTFGKGAAGLTFLGDMLKSVLPVCLAGVIFGFNYNTAISVCEYCYVAAMFVILGHVFPIYYKFKGGKGVLSTFSTIILLAPFIGLFLLLLFIAIVAVSKFVSLGSVCAAMLLPVVINGYFMFFFAKPLMPLGTISTIIIAIVIVWRHKENLKRISEGRENKISIGKKDKE